MVSNNTKDDDSTTVSSHSNNSSHASPPSKVGGFTLPGQQPKQQQQEQQQPSLSTSMTTTTTSRRNKNRNKRRKEQQKQQHPLTAVEVVREEAPIPGSSSVQQRIRPFVLILLFGIGALLGVNVFPLLIASTTGGTTTTGWHRMYTHPANHASYDVTSTTTTTTTSMTTNESKSNRTAKRIPSTVRDVDDAALTRTTSANKNQQHRVKILSSRTIMVYGEQEGSTITSYGGRQHQQPQSQQAPPPPPRTTSPLCDDRGYSSSGCTIGRNDVSNSNNNYPTSTTTSTTSTQHRPGPILCSDGYTRGYDDWRMLREAIHNLNGNYQRIGWNSLQQYYKDTLDDWNQPQHQSFDILQQSSSSSSSSILSDWGLSSSSSSFDIVYMEPPEPFTICPGVTLRGRNNFRGRGGIYVNHPDVVIQCDGCTIDMGGTHFQFGGEAKDVLIRGLSFMGASTSSLLFHEDGADVTLEDCTWSNNSGLLDHGAVADLNSTSTISFFRCEISDSKQRPLRFGTTSTSSSSFSNAFVGSSLIIRNV